MRFTPKPGRTSPPRPHAQHVRRRPAHIRRGLLALAVAIAAATVGTIVAAVPATAVSVPNNIADHTLQGVPPMVIRPGYWYETNDALVRQDADALVSNGLAAKGWNIVAVDDQWMIRADGTDWNGTQVVPASQNGRDLAGNFIASPSGYPNGIQSTIDYVHSKGLKFGIYLDGGTLTCSGGAGSYGHFQADANYLASLGVDYIKTDYCYAPNQTSPPGLLLTTDADADTAISVHREFAEAIQAANAAYGTHMVLNASAPAYFNWDNTRTGTPVYKKVVAGILPSAQLWRTAADTGGTWSSSLNQLEQGVGAQEFARAGHFNDLDQLSFGKGLLTRTQLQAQFSMWAMMASSLNMRVKGAAEFTADLVTDAGNTDVIAVSQDRLGVQATRVSTTPDADIYVKPLANGDFAVALLNKKTTGAVTISTIGSVVGSSATSFTLKNLWTKAVTTSSGTISASVPASSVVLYRVTPGTTFTNSTRARNTTSISDGDAATAGCFDAGCNSYSSDSLAAAGVTAGSTVIAGGRSFTWPNTRSGEPDSILAKGQTINLSGTTLAFLGSSSSGDVSGTLTLRFTNGTQNTTIGFPSWITANPTAFGCSTAITTTGRNTPTGPANPQTNYIVSYCPITVPAGKTLKSITLPNQPALHIFAIATSVSPPQTPAGLTATTAGQTQLNVAWTASAGATGYDLLVDNVLVSNVTSPYPHSGLITGSTHSYRVRAKNAAGESDWSAVVTASPGAPLISKAGWSLVFVDSQETGGENGAATNAFDGNPATIWHTKYTPTVDPLPHEIQIDLGATYAVDSIRYLPRFAGGNGNIGQYEMYVSTSTSSWGTAVATGTFDDTAAEKIVTFTAKTGRYLRLRALTEAGNTGPWTSAAEISATGS